MQLYGKLK